MGCKASPSSFEKADRFVATSSLLAMTALHDAMTAAT
jgi:hypothetical protein